MTNSGPLEIWFNLPNLRPEQLPPPIMGAIEPLPTQDQLKRL